MSSRSYKSVALRKEAKRVQLSEYLQRQRSWRYSFQNPSREKSSVELYHPAQGAPSRRKMKCLAAGLEVSLRKVVIKAIYPRCRALEGRCGDLNQRAVSWGAKFWVLLLCPGRPVRPSSDGVRASPSTHWLALRSNLKAPLQISLFAGQE